MSSNPHPGLPPEEIPPGGKEYRVTRMYLAGGIVSLLFFTAMGASSFYAAWTNTDNSFPNPVGDAVVFGGGWIIPALGSIWFIVFCVRARLFFERDRIRLTGAFRTREVRFSEVNRVVWKPFAGRSGRASSRQGKLVLYDASGKMTVEFDNFAPNQAELIRYFALALAGCEQEGWERFAELYHVNLRPKRIPPNEPGQAPPDSGQWSQDPSAAPVMTRSEYETMAYRTRKSLARVFTGVWLVSLVLVLAISYEISPRNRPAFKQHLDAFYRQFPAIPHAAIAGAGYLIILGAAVGGPLLFNLYVYRFGGLRCPQCHRNMTFRRKTEVVLHRGECPFCHAKLFKEDDQ